MGRPKKVVQESEVQNQKSNGGSTMSATETTEVKAEMKAIEIEKNVKAFNLETFELKNVPIKVSFTPAESYEDAIQRLSAAHGNDSKKLVATINPVLQNLAVRDAKKTALGEGQIPKGVVLKFIANYRMMPQFASLVTSEKGDPGWKKEYDGQTVAILKEIKEVPFIVAGLKAMAASDDSSDESDDE